MKPIYTKTMNHPEHEQLQVVFEAHWENESPDDHFEFQEDKDFAYSGKHDANWFSATVKVELKGTLLFGMDHLGCCSYKSFEEFMQDDYFTDMIKEATNDLINDLNDTSDRINEFVDAVKKAS
jgi:hypothetical protein